MAGLGVGALSLLVPMCQKYGLFPEFVRGALTSTHQLFITFGISLAACINFGTYEHQRSGPISWRLPIGIGFIWIANSRLRYPAVSRPFATPVAEDARKG